MIANKISLDWPWKGAISNNIYNQKENWPKISIVTASYNQGEFIEETILSVLNQSYPNLEYIIIDGGSTDNSVDIIKHYSPHLKYWVSERDRGQTHAINKGFNLCTGELITWLNSDDFYEPMALYNFANEYNKERVDYYQGNARIIDKDGREKGIMVGKPFGKGANKLQDVLMPQPASFFTKEVYDRYGPLDEKLNYAMDMDFWLKIQANNGNFKKIDILLTNFREHGQAKSSQGYDSFVAEILNKYQKGLFTNREKAIISEDWQKRIIKDHIESIISNGSMKKKFFYRYFFINFLKNPFQTLYWLLKGMPRKIKWYLKK